MGEEGSRPLLAAGIPAEVLPVRERADAAREDLVARTREASMLFVSGGNPSYLARVLTGTPLWEAIRVRLDDGLAYAGCSAGVACLTAMTYDSDTQDLDKDLAAGPGRHAPGGAVRAALGHRG